VNRCRPTHYVIGIDNYAYLVPYIENEEELFLKTLSRAERQRRDTSENIMKTKLSKEEILQGFEKGEWVSVADFSKRKKELIE